MDPDQTLGIHYTVCPTGLYLNDIYFNRQHELEGAQWLSGRVLDSRPRGRRLFEPHLRNCVVSLSKNINPSLELVQPRKTVPL